MHIIFVSKRDAIIKLDMWVYLILCIYFMFFPLVCLCTMYMSGSSGDQGERIISLGIVITNLSCYVGEGNWTHILLKNSQF